jgi:hypothetical protein
MIHYQAAQRRTGNRAARQRSRCGGRIIFRRPVIDDDAPTA